LPAILAGLDGHAVIESPHDDGERPFHPRHLQPYPRLVRAHFDKATKIAGRHLGADQQQLLPLVGHADKGQARGQILALWQWPGMTRQGAVQGQVEIKQPLGLGLLETV
jgi:hypothetical protein